MVFLTTQNCTRCHHIILCYIKSMTFLLTFGLKGLIFHTLFKVIIIACCFLNSVSFVHEYSSAFSLVGNPSKVCQEHSLVHKFSSALLLVSSSRRSRHAILAALSNEEGDFERNKSTLGRK